MMQVNVLEAKTDFSKLIRLLETKREDAITVARNGRPIVRMTLVQEAPASNRIGLWRGKYTAYQDEAFDADDEAIAAMLTGGTL